MSIKFDSGDMVSPHISTSFVLPISLPRHVKSNAAQTQLRSGKDSSVHFGCQVKRRRVTSTVVSSLREISYLASPSQRSGTFPSDLTGTFYWLIPSPSPSSSQENGFPPPEHPFDGDAYVLAVSVEDEQWVRGRYVRTKAFLKETRKRKRIYKGRFGDRNVGTPLDKRKKAANEGLVVWGVEGKPRVIAWDTLGLPYTLRGPTVNTRGITNLGGVVCEVGEVEGRGNALGAVARLPRGGLACATIGRNTVDTALGLVFVEIDSKGEMVRQSGKVKVTSGTTLEGLSKRFVVSENYYAFAEIPARKKGLLPFSALEVIDTQSPTKVSFVPRLGKAGARGGFSVRIDAILLALVNITESEGEVQLDVVEADLPDTNCSLAEFISAPGRLCRYKINQETGKVTQSPGYGPMASSLRGCSITDSGIMGCAENRVVMIKGKTNQHFDVKNPSGLCLASNYIAFLTESRVTFLRAETFEEVGSVDVSEIGRMGEARDSVWLEKTWKYEEWGKKGLTSWETFSQHEWNDVDSSFSGLGLNSLTID